MELTLAVETLKHVDQTVLIKGWVAARRDHGKLIFIDLRDRTGLLQIVFNPKLSEEAYKKATELRSEFVVTIAGKVNKRPENLVNPKIVTGTVELEATKLEILSRAETLPFDMGAETLNLELPTLLDHRSLTLRHPRISAIFKVQETIVKSFREVLRQEGFTEIFVPTIVPSTTEGGAEVFPVEYFNHKTYLAQSPQFYKQIMVGVYERVFTVAHAYRAEPSVTTRHLTEYVGLDVEFGFINSWEEIMSMAEKVMRAILEGVLGNNSSELAILGVKPLKLMSKIPRVKLREAQEIIYKRTKIDHRNEPDLDPNDEKEICKWAKEEHRSDLIFITHYPTNKRPFYTMPDPEDPEHTLSFDLIGEGTEWVTGGQRINSYEMLLDHAKKWGNTPEKLATYLEAFKYGMPPEGGFCMGLERVTRDLLNLGNIREASLFPRDMERADIRLAYEEKKNTKKTDRH